ncbi:tRNA (adenosine(37)-N6)-threonylcarbamoyltransferase complex dimerization subunit type 1 TsaB [Spirilliplanes yamanashiensis]|uniref:N(6)-L-threonylcarbamoyladenine synthase n=1 Tax=Spirilliplanes yamanashiensis TaxID=42233 RepID=A0A8J4DKD2_9ACTN|nr:tRNA (adenosine(37)-N6)-threonylcarbamoyltransferase complex dimerization subunit type 1 TsaB [Spirilliplanes yamanashiensis]MDP9815928.1 tRNA threonylcarbamoyl adenosine modification protein YeaZ [Spirilliplanes yamanashiensis]GIJ04184.1 tRNA (adenosine(37)-N6)-threonylcarbamoyltransferase complex dimerization subunit type 1 TsaB [Spirilliplanes yamanashiensis]
MLVLVLDSSTPAVTAAVAEVTDGGVAIVAQRRTVDARAHGELLAPHVAEVLAEAGVRPGELTAIVAGLGPGPFTSLRVGLVTAASMAQVLGVPVYGVCSLDALGRAAGAGRVLAATDARRKEVYWATYADGVRERGPEVARPADVGVTAERAVGEGAQKYADVLGLPVDGELLYPPALHLAELAAGRVRDKAPTEPLTPLYLRRPDAVEPGARKPALR